MQVRAYQECTTIADTVQRCFQISPAALPTGSGATLTFYFYPSQLNGMDCTNMDVHRWNGSGWDTLTLDPTYATNGRDCTNKPHSVRVKEVTAFSAFVLKAVSKPTKVGLTRLVAGSQANPHPFTPWALPVGGLLIGLMGIVIAPRRRSDFDEFSRTVERTSDPDVEPFAPGGANSSDVLGHTLAEFAPPGANG